LALKVNLHNIALLEGYFAQIPTIQRQLERVALHVVQCEIDIHPTNTLLSQTSLIILLAYIDVEFLPRLFS
jgi:hypothetical protein